ncbi:hypothetical protein KQI85_14080 [Falcatimonas sp. MSJ-15]|uniref:hypothetical protein n=1 Tax=Falcatimonas sp. MSJ-15 TaxID=2841515 RepID=UPI001C1257E5|nr:hypothetical protein [Falcatimonas sp. MSJ-15]MBU5471468.1 hypothetical protein [Falcatimonas sp. MSJ-15]
MITAIIVLLTLAIFSNILKIAFKASWAISKVIVTLIAPIVIIALVVAGLVYVAVPLLIIAAVIGLVKTVVR